MPVPSFSPGIKPAIRRNTSQFDTGKAAACGYDNLWNRVRAQYVKEHPLCEECLEQGSVTPVEIVHHKLTVREHPELRLDMDDLQSLCRVCHGKEHSGH
jgi:5-methylcytosine-specific restriction protein A